MCWINYKWRMTLFPLSVHHYYIYISISLSLSLSLPIIYVVIFCLAPFTNRTTDHALYRLFTVVHWESLWSMTSRWRHVFAKPWWQKLPVIYRSPVIIAYLCQHWSNYDIYNYVGIRCVFRLRTYAPCLALTFPRHVLSLHDLCVYTAF